MPFQAADVRHDLFGFPLMHFAHVIIVGQRALEAKGVVSVAPDMHVEQTDINGLV